MSRIHDGHRGFTLLEITFFLVLLGIFSVLLIQNIRVTTRSSLVAVDWLQEATTLQAMMEDIVSEYKRIITEAGPEEVTLQSDLQSLNTYAQSNYGSYILTGETGYIYFDANGTSTWPPQSSIAAQEPVLLITLQNGEQRLSSMFMASQ